ncbi:MAG: hypothetical protein A2787_03955 [Omnitrophica WOR_2 bacterium RIFCSPHIGHO2_01_FULL_48_9]|nr:MAG: hypothetical protein A3D10_04400 [Omnitrophica WOR_2 bacterium RIFCSPHIGHO2_02_FULL_48_11]OGX29910.1 MAG: hypothetical protein A2787_03955 [Omnitrophica WOR_2 bacterium RIFCSPHIGHO2_01_FULL_48_9]
MADSKKKEKISLEEYLAQQKKNKKAPFQLPPSLKIALATPFLIIFCFGLFYLPFMIFNIATGKEKKQDTASDYQSIKKSSARSSIE